MSDVERLLTRGGILMPRRLIRASRDADTPVHVGAAFLEQETGGGRNVYGHDVDAHGNPRPFWGHGQVTRANYAAYKRERDLGVREDRWRSLGRRSQGVGPMQLTWWEYQDRADRAGGCWRPYVNILVGLSILRSLNRPGSGWRDAAHAWNPNPGYADEVTRRIARWRDILGGR